MYEFEKWQAEILPDDGGRISVLRYAGQDLLTAPLFKFRAPLQDYGLYETRPVYGYDDCFPTVDACKYPTADFDSEDHGQLCWQKWKVESESNKVICSVDCDRPEAGFVRTLEFGEKSLSWQFEVINRSKKTLPFLHVMHALIPLQEIESIEVSDFKAVVNEIDSTELGQNDSKQICNHLLDIKAGDFKMLLLKDIENGVVNLGFKNGMKLKMEYNANLFSTLGIWWNNAGYPDEDGLRRTECAFEPIGGTCSDLAKTFEAGRYMKVAPGESFDWGVSWEISI